MYTPRRTGTHRPVRTESCQVSRRHARVEGLPSRDQATLSINGSRKLGVSVVPQHPTTLDCRTVHPHGSTAFLWKR